MKLSGIGLVAALLLLTCPVSAAPLLGQANLPQAASSTVDAKVICYESGQCVRPPVRRPVARWVYGDTNFYGPYAGPGNYGNPRYRYNRFPFYWW